MDAYHIWADLKPGTVVAEIDGVDAREFLEERAKAAWNAPSAE